MNNDVSQTDYSGYIPNDDREDLNVLHAAKEHWKAEHDVELARRQEAEAQLARVKRQHLALLIQLETIADMIDLDADAFYGNHSERTGATKLWREILKRVIDRHTDKPKPNPEDIPF